MRDNNNKEKRGFKKEIRKMFEELKKPESPVEVPTENTKDHAEDETVQITVNGEDFAKVDMISVPTVPFQKVNDEHFANVDMISLTTVPFQKVNDEHFALPTISDEIIEDLPPLLKETIDIVMDDTEQKVLLLSALAVISGMLPNYYATYDGNKLSSNLYVYIVGKFGTGKGSAKYARLLGNPLHKLKKSIYKEALQLYARQQEEIADSRARDELTRPKQSLLFMPADISKAGTIQLSADNESIIIMETEGDTLVAALKADFGQFTDNLNKAFHHEPITMYRKTGKEFVEDERPCWSLLITSTLDQLRRLIYRTQDGLASRIIFFRLNSTSHFRNVFDNKKASYEEAFEAIGIKLKNISVELEHRKNPLFFTLTPQQEEEFLKYFKEMKKDLSGMDEDLEGIVNRLGIICFRICMIFSFFRSYHHSLTTITCIDTDFNNAIKLISIIKQHNLSIYYELQSEVATNKFTEKANQKQQALELHQQGNSYQQIADKLGLSKTTVHNWINKK